MGAYPLNFSNAEYVGHMGSVKGTSCHIDNSDVATAAARLGHDVWLRHWEPDNDYDPGFIVTHMPYVPDDVRALIGFDINNEWDWGWGRRSGEGTLAWFKRMADKYIAVMALAYAAGWRRFSVLNSSMGTPDITDPDVREGIRLYFKPLYDNQTVSGDPNDTRKVEIWIDWHGYVPKLEWLWDDGKVPPTLQMERFISLVPGGLFDVPPLLNWGETAIKVSAEHRDPKPEMIWLEPSRAGFTDYRGGRLAQALPPTNRIIHPNEWFTGRWKFCFWPEMGIGFNPLVKRMRASETLFDEGGWGGAPAHHYSALQVNQGVLRMNELNYAPLELASGVFVPSPFGTSNIFVTTDQDSKWSAGYSVAYAIRDPAVNIQKWIVHNP